MTVRGIIIGINYSDKIFKLRFPQSDARKFQHKLLEYYPQAQLQYLSADGTKQRILQKLTELVQQTKPGDYLFWFFSGHGTQVADLNGDESDGWDEAILAADAPNFTDRTYLITDDEIADILGELPVNAKFRGVIDACHSGTYFDLNYQTIQTAVLAWTQPRIPRDFKFSAIALTSSKDSEQSFENGSGGLLTSVLVAQNWRQLPVKLLQTISKPLSKLQTTVLQINDPSNLSETFVE